MGKLFDRTNPFTQVREVREKCCRCCLTEPSLATNITHVTPSRRFYMRHILLLRLIRCASLLWHVHNSMQCWRSEVETKTRHFGVFPGVAYLIRLFCCCFSLSYGSYWATIEHASCSDLWRVVLLI